MGRMRSGGGQVSGVGWGTGMIGKSSIRGHCQQDSAPHSTHWAPMQIAGERPGSSDCPGVQVSLRSTRVEMPDHAPYSTEDLKTFGLNGRLA